MKTTIQTIAVLHRIERVLLRIAEQMDVELSEAEKQAAMLRKRRRPPRPETADEGSETGQVSISPEA